VFGVRTAALVFEPVSRVVDAGVSVSKHGYADPRAANLPVLRHLAFFALLVGHQLRQLDRFHRLLVELGRRVRGPGDVGLAVFVGARALGVEGSPRRDEDALKVVLADPQTLVRGVELLVAVED
jgi:hypothetical protein